MAKFRNVYVVGSGPSSYAFVSGLRKSGFSGEVTVFTGENPNAIINRSAFNFKGVSPKQLQESFIKSVDRFTYSNGDFYSLSTLGVGGGARFWGASLSDFDGYAISRNGFDYDSYCTNIKSVAELLGIRNWPRKQNSRFFDCTVEKLFSKSNSLCVSQPNLAVDESLCTLCGNCLAGCSYGAIWSPSLSDFIKLGVHIVHDYIEKLAVVDSAITHIFGLGGNRYRVNGDIFLAVNPISFYKLISSSFETSEAYIGATPSIAFAIPKFSRPFSKPYFGMGVATISVSEDSKIIGYGNVYDGRGLSDFSTNVFSLKNGLLDIVKKQVVKNFWLGLLFTSSDNLMCRINKHASVNLVSNLTENAFTSLKKTLRSSVNWWRPIYFKAVKPGAELHYCNGVPDDLRFDRESGRALDLDNLFALGAPNFKYLPPESPTLSFMANAFGVAVKYVSK